MPSRLTFGIEIEFAVLLLDDGKPDPEPHLSQPLTSPRRAGQLRHGVYELIADEMSAAGLPTRTLRDNEMAPRIEYDNMWIVTEDVSIHAANPGSYEWYPVEVQSPPYIFCEDSLQAVKLACKVITNKFRVETNTTTGLHIHVGNGSNGYTLTTIKKLIGFLWTFEPQIDQLHPNRRAYLTPEDNHTWYESLRRGSTISKRPSRDGSYPIKVLEGLQLIYSAADLSALELLMRAVVFKSAYKFDHLLYGDTIKRTVEFRQHEGVLDGARVTEWIKTVVAIMEWIIDVDTSTLFEFLAAAAAFEDHCWPADERPPYDVIQLFMDIGLLDQAAYWDAAIPPSVRNMPTLYYQRPRSPKAPRDENAAPPTIVSDDDDQVMRGRTMNRRAQAVSGVKGVQGISSALRRMQLESEMDDDFVMFGTRNEWEDCKW